MKYHHLFYLSMLFSTSALAATPIDLNKHSLADLEKRMKVALHSSQLEKVRADIDLNQVVHTKIQQTYQGLPVWNASAVIHTPLRQVNTTDSSQTKISGLIYDDLEKDLAKAPAYTLSDAQKNKALQETKLSYEKKLGTTGIHFQDESIQPIIYVDQDKKAHYAYLISFATNDDSVKKPNIIVDAVNLTTYRHWVS